MHNIINASAAALPLSSESVDLIVTSPPYDNLRTYKGYTFDAKQVIAECVRVIRPGKCIVWVIGDAVLKGTETGSSFKQALYFQECGMKLHDTMIYEKNSSSFPARRNGNRYTQIFEYMFVFSKGKPAVANLICDKENKWAGWVPWGKQEYRDKDGTFKERKQKPVPKHSPRTNIWKYTTGLEDQFSKQHPAAFPLQLATDHILTWSNEGDTVLDPMCGSSTTGKAAITSGRNYIGCDISAEYCALGEKRLKGLEEQSNE